MEFDREFEALVRKTGTVFTTNLGNGPEEMVLAVATPCLRKTQVATQADLVAAGYVRVEGLKRLEDERARLQKALRDSEQNFARFVADSARRGAEQRAKIEQLRTRIALLEKTKGAEEEGVIARNEGVLASENPYPPEHLGGEPMRAWARGWRLRDVLLNFNEKLKAFTADQRETYQDFQHLEAQIERMQTEKEALLAELRAIRHTANANRQLPGTGQKPVASPSVPTTSEEHEALVERYSLQNVQLQKVQSAYQRLLLEAPHATDCDRTVGVGGCNCWLLKFGFAALE